MDTKTFKLKNLRIKRRDNWMKDALVKRVYELGEFDGVDLALVICKPRYNKEIELLRKNRRDER